MVEGQFLRELPLKHPTNSPISTSPSLGTTSAQSRAPLPTPGTTSQILRSDSPDSPEPFPIPRNASPSPRITSRRSRNVFHFPRIPFPHRSESLSLFPYSIPHPPESLPHRPDDLPHRPDHASQCFAIIRSAPWPPREFTLSLPPRPTFRGCGSRECHWKLPA